jgi:polyisoprenoid-binding protein YceI
MRTALLLALFTLTLVGASAQTTWVVDPIHSNVKFTVTHLLVSEVDGNFTVYSGSIQSNGSAFDSAAVDFTVDASSINTGNERRDAHLKSADFFDVARFPSMTFQSISWKKVGEREYELTGDLTIHDVTKPVTFRVLSGGTMKDGYGNVKAGFKASATINRFDYGLKWNAVTEMGGAVVAKEVAITLNLQFAQKKSSSYRVLVPTQLREGHKSLARVRLFLSTFDYRASELTRGQVRQNSFWLIIAKASTSGNKKLSNTSVNSTSSALKNPNVNRLNSVIRGIM